MTWVEIEPQFQPLFSRCGLVSFDEIAAHFAGDAPPRGEVLVRRGTVPASGADQPVDVYFKEYRLRAPSWRFWHRASKARREFENYRGLAALGVPAAERVASGEKRDALGRLLSAFIITRAVPDAATLVEFAATRPAEAVRRRLNRELAGIARRLHQAGFFYHDLVWRNILVSGREAGCCLVLIDCPRGALARWGRRRRQLRDLASLDKSAVKYCRRPERLRFLLAYLGKTRVDEEVRRLANACAVYRRRRWPEDWGKR